MKILKIFLPIMFLIMVNAAQATIADIVILKIDGVAVNNQLNHLPEFIATNGNWNKNDLNKKIPLAPGHAYQISFSGDLIDLFSRIELTRTDGTGTVPGIKVSTLTKSSKNVTLTITVDPSVAEDQNFMLRFRYLAEINCGEGMCGDNVKFEVVQQGSINNITINPAPLRSHDTTVLQRNTTYTLAFTCSGAVGTNAAVVTNFTSGTLIPGLAFNTPIISASSANNFSMQIKCNTITTAVGNLLDFLKFKIIDKNVDPAFQSSLSSSFVAYTFNNSLPNTGTSFSLKKVQAGQVLPDLIPSSVGLNNSFSLDATTIQDKQGNTYRKINNTCPLITNINGIFSNNETHKQRDLINDPLLGTITLHVVLPGTVTIDVKNGSTTKAVTETFVVRVRSNRVTDQVQTLSDNITPDQLFILGVPQNTDYTITSNIGPGQVNSKNLNHRILQIFTFSNRPGEFFVDNRVAAESQVNVNVDLNNNVPESVETNNSKTF